MHINTNEVDQIIERSLECTLSNQDAPVWESDQQLMNDYLVLQDTASVELGSVNDQHEEVKTMLVDPMMILSGTLPSFKEPDEAIK